MSNEQDLREDDISVSAMAGASWSAFRRLVFTQMYTTQRTINQILREVRTLAQNDAELTQAVTNIVNDYAADYQALSAQIEALTKASANQDSAAQDAAIASLQTLDTTMKANTAAAQQAITALAPAPSVPSAS